MGSFRADRAQLGTEIYETLDPATELIGLGLDVKPDFGDFEFGAMLQVPQLWICFFEQLLGEGLSVVGLPIQIDLSQ